MAIWLPATAIMCLVLQPYMKGGTIGICWATGVVRREIRYMNTPDINLLTVEYRETNARTRPPLVNGFSFFHTNDYVDRGVKPCRRRAARNYCRMRSCMR